ncbi:hypothetical protein O0L34_g9358 [Tuta absoluta]|nr:hypothetical protein O0L34_g9358 [Tuta absoluta]
MSSKNRKKLREHPSSPASVPNLGRLEVTLEAILSNLATLEQRAGTPASVASDPTGVRSADLMGASSADLDHSDPSNACWAEQQHPERRWQYGSSYRSVTSGGVSGRNGATH